MIPSPSKLVSSAHSHRLLLPFLLLTLSIILLTYKLNSTHLTSFDEAWYAAIARDMAETSDFITPTYNSRTWFAVSPLYLWLSAIWFQISAFNLAGIRLISVCFALGSILLTMLIGSKLTNRRTGLIAAFILTTSIQFLYRSRTGNLDIPLTFFHLIAVYAFIKGRDHHLWYPLIGIASALGFLTKNIFGLPPLILLLFTPPPLALTSLLAFLIIVIPWPLLAYSQHGMEFVRHHLFQYAFSKIANQDPTPSADFFWYLLQLKPGLKLWVLSLLPALLLPLYQRLRSQQSFPFPSRLLLAWFLPPLILLSFTALKNNWYLIPLYPVIALILAGFWNWLFSLKPSRIWRIFITTLILIQGILNTALYHHQFIVPETVAAEVKLCTHAKNITSVHQPIMLDDAYLPLSVLYSHRLVIPLRYSRQAQSLVGETELQSATQSGARLVLTNTQTLDQLLRGFHHPEYVTLNSVDDKLLIRLIFPADLPTNPSTNN